VKNFGGGKRATARNSKRKKKRKREGVQKREEPGIGPPKKSLLRNVGDKGEDLEKWAVKTSHMREKQQQRRSKKKKEKSGRKRNARVLVSAQTR